MSASLGVRNDRVPAVSLGATSSRVPALTGVRAVAALLVVSTHAAFATGYLTHGYVGAMYARLEIGVAIFFVLSGFLLFRPWVRASAQRHIAAFGASLRMASGAPGRCPPTW